MNKKQIEAIKCAYADLQGSLQAIEQGDASVHDWRSHAQTIEELEQAFKVELDIVE